VFIQALLRVLVQPLLAFIQAPRVFIIMRVVEMSIPPAAHGLSPAAEKSIPAVARLPTWAGMVVSNTCKRVEWISGAGRVECAGLKESDRAAG
jgi:hypothetical protein